MHDTSYAPTTPPTPSDVLREIRRRCHESNRRREAATGELVAWLVDHRQTEVEALIHDPVTRELHPDPVEAEVRIWGKCLEGLIRRRMGEEWDDAFDRTATIIRATMRAELFRRRFG
ncbi:hypothetical protein JL100_018065 [Skermanella mucosa]|uniref:hypothetical protein n=1 Tax=Skermanella mucosa TaxID=1789672 RepID=UPI00192C89F4|nr:hypothetical protein [Skermanella mucosa]UEM18992.1 hypothetical protein JL100_018065 [Skermanella mucosa]